MTEKRPKIALPSLDDLFSTEESRVEASLEKVEYLKISDIDEFKNHPFKVLDNKEMDLLVASIQDEGLIEPVIVRKKNNGRYEMISGHRRKRACEIANLDMIPCIVRDLDDCQATIAMTISNLHRKKKLPSEEAFSLSMCYEAMKKQGKRNDLTCDQNGHKLKNKKSIELLAEEVNSSKTDIQRYLRITKLIPELLDILDQEKWSIDSGADVSFLSEDEQHFLFDSMSCYDCVPSKAQALELKELSKQGKLTSDIIDKIMSKPKPNQIEHIKIKSEKLKKVLPSYVKNEDIEDYLLGAVRLRVQYEKSRSVKQAKER